jgi:thiol-disulfide isomerase/thioredoxin
MSKNIFFLTMSLLAPLTAGAAPAGISANISAAFAKAGLPLLKDKRQPRDFTLKTLDGRSMTLSQLKGKVVFLNFWATWCPPCRGEMPSMEALYQRFKNDGLEFVAVDLRESQPEVKDFITDNKLTFPVALDATGNVGNNYNIQSIPSTYIIDRDGKIIVQAVGGRSWNTPAMISAFQALLKNE